MNLILLVLNMLGFGEPLRWQPVLADVRPRSRRIASATGWPGYETNFDHSSSAWWFSVVGWLTCSPRDLRSDASSPVQHDSGRAPPRQGRQDSTG